MLLVYKLFELVTLQSYLSHYKHSFVTTISYDNITDKLTHQHNI